MPRRYWRPEPCDHMSDSGDELFEDTWFDKTEGDYDPRLSPRPQPYDAPAGLKNVVPLRGLENMGTPISNLMVEFGVVYYIEYNNNRVYSREDVRKRDFGHSKTPNILDNPRYSPCSQGEHQVTALEIKTCLEGRLCALCFNTIQTPCLLPCLHTFCHKCIHESIANNSEDPPYGCPLCASKLYPKNVADNKFNVTYGDVQLIRKLEDVNSGQKKITHKCKEPGCRKSVAHYCTKCREKGTFCSDHGDMHEKMKGKKHSMKSIAIKGHANKIKDGFCRIHNGCLINFLCTACPGHTSQCMKCALDDKDHDEHRLKLSMEDISMCILFEDKLQALQDIEALVMHKIDEIKSKIEQIEQQFSEEQIELTWFISQFEQPIEHFKKKSYEQLRYMYEAVIFPLTRTLKRLLSDNHRIQIAKEALTCASENLEDEYMCYQLGHAIRFTQQLISTRRKYNINIRSQRIISRISGTTVGELEKMSQSFMFGLSSLFVQPKETNGSDREKTSAYYIRIPTTSFVRSKPLKFDFSDDDSTFSNPWSICVHPINGLVYVTDETKQSVNIFDKELNLLSSHYTGLIFPYVCHGPRGIAISDDGLIVVADSEANRVYLYMDTFTLVKTIGGRRGQENGQFNRPYCVSFDSKGHFYVADSGNCRIQKFDSQGNFMRAFGDQTEEGGVLKSYVNSIAVNEKDEVLVLCAGSQFVRVFTADGKMKEYIGISRPTDVKGKSQVFRAFDGHFGISDCESGIIKIYDYNGDVKHRLDLDDCVGPCFSPDGFFYVVSLFERAMFRFPIKPELHSWNRHVNPISQTNCGDLPKLSLESSALLNRLSSSTRATEAARNGHQNPVEFPIQSNMSEPKSNANSFLKRLEPSGAHTSLSTHQHALRTTATVSNRIIDYGLGSLGNGMNSSDHLKRHNQTTSVPSMYSSQPLSHMNNLGVKSASVIDRLAPQPKAYSSPPKAIPTPVFSYSLLSRLQKEPFNIPVSTAPLFSYKLIAKAEPTPKSSKRRPKSSNPAAISTTKAKLSDPFSNLSHSIPILISSDSDSDVLILDPDYYSPLSSFCYDYGSQPVAHSSSDVQGPHLQEYTSPYSVDD